MVRIYGRITAKLSGPTRAADDAPVSENVAERWVRWNALLYVFLHARQRSETAYLWPACLLKDTTQVLVCPIEKAPGVLLKIVAQVPEAGERIVSVAWILVITDGTWHCAHIVLVRDGCRAEVIGHQSERVT